MQIKSTLAGARLMAAGTALLATAGLAALGGYDHEQVAHQSINRKAAYKYICVEQTLPNGQPLPQVCLPLPIS